MNKFLHIMSGYFVLGVSGEDGIRLFNILANKKIFYWSPITYDGGYRLKCSIFNIMRIMKLAADSDIALTVVKTVGLPFIVYKYRYRAGAVLGSFIALFIMFMSSLCVWEINIIGISNIPEQDIIDALKKVDLTVGTFLPSFDIRKSELNFILENKNVSSVSINILGTYVNVEIIEQVEKPDFDNSLGIFDIIASEDGVITSIKPHRGTPMFKVGDAILKNEIAISAFIVSKNGTMTAYHADGEVLAAVRRDFSVEIPFDYRVRDYSGSTSKKTDYTLLGRFLPLYFSEKPPYEFFDSTVTTEKITIFGLKTPIVKNTVEYAEYEQNIMRIDEALAREYAVGALYDYLATLGENIISVDYDGEYDENRDSYIFDAMIYIEKSIGIEKEAELPGLN